MARLPASSVRLPVPSAWMVQGQAGPVTFDPPVTTERRSTPSAMERTHTHPNGLLMRGSMLLFLASLFTLVFLLSSCQREELLSPIGSGQTDDNGGSSGGNGNDDPAGDDNGGNGNDDPAGDDNGGNGSDDPAGDDNGGNGNDDPAGDDNGGDNGGNGSDDPPGDDNGGDDDN